MSKRVFYSFHYKPDVMRVAQIRNIGTIEGNRAATDNTWELVKSGKELSIKRWISEQMRGKSCTIVLVGENTANRKWINHEIIESWDKGMGVVGIRIHGIKSTDGTTTKMGANPFDFVTHVKTGRKLSSIVKCYNPEGSTSKEKYAWIAKHVANAVAEAVQIRKEN